MVYGLITFKAAEALQRAMERAMFRLIFRDRIPNEEIHGITKVDNVMKPIAIAKWQGARHIARKGPEKWTVRAMQ